MKVIYQKLNLNELLKRRLDSQNLKKDEDKIFLTKKVSLFFWWLAILSFISVAYIYQYARLTKVKNDIVAIKVKIRKTKNQINDLERELVKLKDIKRIKKMAKSYGMKEADVIKFIKVNQD